MEVVELHGITRSKASSLVIYVIQILHLVAGTFDDLTNYFVCVVHPSA